MNNTATPRTNAADGPFYNELHANAMKDGELVDPETDGCTIHSFKVVLGYYDPDRWEGEGGIMFATETELLVDRRYVLPGKRHEYHVKVLQRGNSFATIEEAEQRAEVNRQILDLAHFVQDQLDAGESLNNIYAWLQENLKPGTPVTSGFRYNRL